MKRTDRSPKFYLFLLLFLCLVGLKSFSQSTSVVIIDGDFSKKQQVMEALGDAQIVYLTSGTNPWKAIRESLETDKNITTIHLFVDASYNEIQMGGILYNLETLGKESELGMLEGLYQGNNYQLLIYNCNLGSNQDGTELLGYIGQRTYMNVVACTNCTSIFDADFAFDYKTLDEPLPVSIIQN